MGDLVFLMLFVGYLGWMGYMWWDIARIDRETQAIYDNIRAGCYVTPEERKRKGWV